MTEFVDAETSVDTETWTELEREALTRVRHLVSGEATIEDVESVKRWKHASRAHEDAFALASRLWDRLGPAGRNVLERSGEQLLSGWPKAMQPHPSRRAVLGGAVAAAAAGAYVVVRPPFDLWPSLSELTADYRTAVGEQRRVALADGAFAELNTQTSMTLRSGNEDRRRIEIISGEAVINTGADLQAPLTVIVGGDRISARNATFNVRYDGRSSCSVTCLDGVVDVERSGNVATIEARHRISFQGQGPVTLEKVDPELVTAWQSGLLVFQHTPLSSVIAEINRYRPGKIVLMNDDLGRRPVNARFRIDNVDEIMTLAQRVFGAKIRSLPGGLVLLS